MTVEKPATTCNVWLVNGTDIPVDFYLNDAPEPEETDIKALSIGPEVIVDGTLARPFQVYSFQARAKDDLGGPILAAASADLQEGEVFAAVFHYDGAGGYAMSIFRTDFSASSESRLEVRNVSDAKFAEWQLFPKQSADPRIPPDERMGGLGVGQYQQATEIIENDYVLEGRVDGRLVARLPDFELEANKMIVAYLVGVPEPTNSPGHLKRHWLEQEIQIPTGIAKPEETRAPQTAYSTSDTNEPVLVECSDTEVFETNPVEMPITATDPDGFVNSVLLLGVEPDVGAAEIPDNSFERSSAVGEPASASVALGGDFPPGNYDVDVAFNDQTIADQARCTGKLTVKPVTIDRLRSEVDRYQVEGDLSSQLGTDLRSQLTEADNQLESGELAEACLTLEQFVTTALDASGSGITDPAAKAIERETGALRARLGCG